MPIPRLIHFCWLSGEERPLKVEQCLASWQRHLVNYEITIWDQESFDIGSVPFVEEACAARRWLSLPIISGCGHFIITAESTSIPMFTYTNRSTRFWIIGYFHRWSFILSCSTTT